VTPHVPLNRRTRGMISDREPASMKPTSYVINPCRGPVVDEQELAGVVTRDSMLGVTAARTPEPVLPG